MHPTLQLVDRFEELLTRQDAQLPYDFPTMFPTDGFWARRASQRKLGFLRKVDEPLRAMLHPDERVLFFTHAVAHSFWESYLLGFPMYYLNRRVLVLTTERLILVQIDSRRRPRELRAQVPLGAVEGFRRTLLGNTVMRLRSGQRYVFVRVPRRDRKRLIELIAGAQTRAAASAGAGLQQLCPWCFQVVEGHPVECPACHGAFKSWRKAGLLSLLFPGLGDVYLGHTRFAVLEILVAGLFWLSILLAIVAPDPQAPLSAGDIASTAFTGFLLLHGGDCLGTFHIAKKGHYPAQRREAAASSSGLRAW